MLAGQLAGRGAQLGLADAVVGDVPGQAQRGDQAGHVVGGRERPAAAARGVAQLRHPVGQPARLVPHHVRHQQAGRDAVRDAVAGADLLAHHVAEAAGGGARQRVGEPGGELVLGPDGGVLGVGLGQRQRPEQAPDRVQREHVREGMVAGAQVALDGVVERADAGAEPEPQRGRERQLRVIDDGVGQHPRVAAPGLGAGGVGEPGARGELGHGQGGGHRDVGEAALVPAPVRHVASDDLGRVDRAAPAQADDEIGAGRVHLGGGPLDLAQGRVLPDGDGGDRRAVGEGGAEAAGHRLVRRDRAGGDQRDAGAAEAGDLARELGDRAGTPPDHRRVGVGEDAHSLALQ